MKQLFIAFSLLTSSFCLATDLQGKISGSVVDKELQEPIPYATIVVNDMEGNLVSGNTSQEDGSFSIEKLPAGHYIFKVQFIGYKTYSKEINISRDHRNIQMGTVPLQPDVAMLDGVTVVAEKSTIEQRIDRKVINIGKDLTTTGPTAADIMNNLPSVSVDQDGNISLRGNSNVRVLLDGKPTNMDASQLLQQIPSTSIKKIELITNPSAKYNPEGMSGIINIVLYKNQKNGFNGNLSTGATFGDHNRYNGSLDLNYRQGKFNLYGNLGGNFGKSLQGGQIGMPDEGYVQKFSFFRDRTSYLYKIGADYYLNENNTLSIYTNQNHYDGLRDGYIGLFFQEQPADDFRQLLDMEVTNTNSSYNFLYDHDFKKEGHNLQLELDLNRFDQDEDTKFNYSNAPSGYTAYKDLVHQNRENFTANLDYVNPLGKNAKLEMGAEARLLDTRNRYVTTNEELDNIEYKYNSDIYSFYTTYGQDFGKFSYQAGARFESYKVEALLEGEQIYTDDYFSLYPSASLNFKPGGKSSYQLSYSRRVDRPGFGQVSPIRNISAPRLTQKGNPELEPQFTNSVEFNYTRKLPEGSLNGSLFYRNINNEISQVIYEDPQSPGSLVLSNDNFDDSNSYGIEISTNYDLTKWWSTNTSFELYSQEQTGVVASENYQVRSSAYSIKSSHNFKVTEALKLQAFGYYRSRSEGLQLTAKPLYYMNLGSRYSFWDNKATLSLNFNDVFNSMKFGFEGGRPFRQEGFFKGETQTIYLGFSYRFGSSKSKALQRKQRDDNQLRGGGMI